MPFDISDFPGALPEDRATSLRNRRLVAGWLFAVCGMILVMVVLGGVTRLTGSGLSIMEWAPFRGALPPLSEREWQRLFALYQDIPQYKLVNQGFGLDGFKQIFWLEYVHRLWGRLIGLAFLAPLVLLWRRRRIARGLRPRLAALFLLGGAQGGVGWFMVASGFAADATAVSPYRLVIHLALALTLYAALLWTGLSVLHPAPAIRAPAALPAALSIEQAAARLRWMLRLACALVALTMLAGGFVAGIHAGLDYNTFPLMDGRLAPDGYARLAPFWRNLTENVAAVQFNHRVLATSALLAVLAALWAASRASLAPWRELGALALLAALQYGLGIATLLAVVPPGLGALHQGVAMLVLTAALAALHAAGHPGASRPQPPHHLARPPGTTAA